MKKPMTVFQAVFLAVAGLILGSIFTFGMRAWNAPIERKACAAVDTEFVSYRKIIQRGHVKEIAIDCADGSRFFVDGACLNDGLTDALERLEEGEHLRILTRPNSSTILELAAGDAVLLELDTCLEKLAAEAAGFGCFGILAYLCGIAGIVNLLRIAMSHKKRK